MILMRPRWRSLVLYIGVQCIATIGFVVIEFEKGVSV